MVKRALGRFAAELRPPSQVRRDLAVAVKRAMNRFGSGPMPVMRSGSELCAEIEFSSEACAVAATAIPAVRRAGPRLVSYAATDVPEWYRCLGAIWTLARAAQGGSYG